MSRVPGRPPSKGAWRHPQRQLAARCDRRRPLTDLIDFVQSGVLTLISNMQAIVALQASSVRGDASSDSVYRERPFEHKLIVELMRHACHHDGAAL